MLRSEKKLPLTHAKHESGEIKYVLDVHNGNACNCRCPKCNEPLTAKHGNKDVNEKGHIPHFAHQSGKEMCDGAQMSIMHLKAQQIIDEHKFVRVPRYKSKEECRMDFVTTNIEERREWPGIKPDVLGITADGRKWAIEIYYTNKVDRIKEEKLRQLGVSCLEINISNQSFDDLEPFLLNSSRDRHWINNPNYDEIISNEERLKEEKDRSEVENVVKNILEKPAFQLPEKSYISSRIIHPNSKPKGCPTSDKLFSVVKITDEDGAVYYICIGTRDSISRNLQSVDRKQKHNYSILTLYIDDLYKEENLFASDFNYKWFYNSQYEKEEEKRKPQREVYKRYYSRPDKWFLKMLGTPVVQKCEVNKGCNKCVCLECVIDYEGAKYVVCDLEKMKRESRKIIVENHEKYLSASVKIDALLQSFSEERAYPWPLSCNSIKDFNDFLQNKGFLNWNGVDNRIDICMISSDEKYVIVVHHDNSILQHLFYITEFSYQKYNMLARTKNGSRDEIVKLFTEVKNKM